MPTLTLQYFSSILSLSKLVFCFGLLIACPSHALTINSQLPGVQLEQELKIWQDPSRKMSVNEVTVQRDLGRFQAQKSARHSLGYSRNAVWFSFVLNNPSSADIVNYVEYTEAQIASVSLYTRSAGESWQVQHFHAAQSAESRPLATIRPVFLQKIPAHTQVEVLMRVIYSDQEDMAGPIISDVRIWGEQNFIHANNEEMLLWGGMAGIMLLVAFAALAVFFASKDKTFLFYGLNLLSLTLSLIHI